MDDRQKKYGRKMIGDIFQHDFMIKISICDTFELTKHVFSGSGQMPLNTLHKVERFVLGTTFWDVDAP